MAAENVACGLCQAISCWLVWSVHLDVNGGRHDQFGVSVPVSDRAVFVGEGGDDCNASGIDGRALTEQDIPRFEIWISTDLNGNNWSRLDVFITLGSSALQFEIPQNQTDAQLFVRILER